MEARCRGAHHAGYRAHVWGRASVVRNPAPRPGAGSSGAYPGVFPTYSCLMNTPAHTAYLLLGSNLGNRVDTLHRALLALAEKPSKIVAVSPVYETAAWGLEAQPAF